MNLLAAINSLDENLFILINGQIHSQFLNHFFLFFSFYPLILWLLIGVAVMVFEERKEKTFILRLILALLVSGFLASVLIKPIVKRPRPDATLGEQVVLVNEKPAGIPAHNDYSFPSGHAAIAFAGVYILLREEQLTAAKNKEFEKQKKLLRVIYLGMAILTAVSRIYLGKHYPTDVIAGGILGWSAGWMTGKFIDFFKPPVVS